MTGMDPRQRRETDQGMKLYRPTPDGGLEPAPVEGHDYRRRLRSRRWDAAALENPEAGSTDPRIAVAAIVGLLIVTFVALILGYATGFWS
jgi:hypothetical protein